MPKLNSEYWKQRMEILQNAQMNKGEMYLEELDRQYKIVSKNIESEISMWYRRFSVNNKITMLEAKQLLRTKDLAEFKWDIQEYIKYGEENAINRQWIKELENASARAHISRLEALKLQMQQQVEVLYGNQTDGIDRLMRTVYSDGYYQTAFEIQKGISIGYTLHAINKNQLDKLISKPWTLDGKTFSDRLWTNKNQLIGDLQTYLIQSVITGKGPDEIIKRISEKFNTDKSKAGRLVMTESAAFASAAQKDCFNELGVEEFEVVATLDSHTSVICQELDGKHFPMKDYQVGITAPPFHVWCRSTTAPYFEDGYGERAARGKDGKTYYVPESMKYKDWKHSFVDGGANAGLTTVVASVLNSTQDSGIISQTRQALNVAGVEHRPVQKFERIPSESEIIQRLSGGDLTKGSCSSLAFAYSGNINGLDVLDFRGGSSRSIFASNTAINDIANLTGVNGTVLKEHNDFIAVNKLLKKVEDGKHYYLGTGAHAAIIKRTKNGFEYLELQSATDNGFKSLTKDVLRGRFGCRKSHTIYKQKVQAINQLIECESLKGNSEFEKLLGYINTVEKSQMKGVMGSVK